MSWENDGYEEIDLVLNDNFRQTSVASLDEGLIELVNINKELDELNKEFYDPNFQDLFKRYNTLLQNTFDKNYGITHKIVLDFNDSRVISWREFVEDSINKYLPYMLDNQLTDMNKSIELIKKTAKSTGNPQMASITSLSKKLFEEIQVMSDRIKNKYITEKVEKMILVIEEYINAVYAKQYLYDTVNFNDSILSNESNYLPENDNKTTNISHPQYNKFTNPDILDKFKPNLSICDIDIEMRTISYHLRDLQCESYQPIVYGPIIQHEKEARQKYLKLREEFYELEKMYKELYKYDNNIESTIFDIKESLKCLDQLYWTSK